MTIILETERLILRTWQDSDLETMAAINQDPKVMEYFPSLLDKAQTKELIDRINAHYEQYGYTLYAVCLKSTNELIGFVGLFTPNFEAHFTPTTEIGWRLSSTHWGKGYAPEAAKAVLDYAFNTLGIEEIVSFTTEANYRSRKVMEKIGLTHNPEDDFDHPNLTIDHPLCRHVLYRLARQS